MTYIAPTSESQQQCGLDILQNKENIDAKYLVGLSAVACAFEGCNAVLPIDMPGARLDSGVCIKKKAIKPYTEHVLADYDGDEQLTPTISRISPEERERIWAVVDNYGRFD